MDPRLLRYYNRELQFIREMGGEFAAEFPKIASRLTLDGFECADPYVERLLEGFAFLTARVQLKLDSEFPRFTQHLLEAVYPDYLAPLPSMAVVQIQPELQDSGLANGYKIARGTAIRSRIPAGEQTACEFRLGHGVELWPLQLSEAEYLPSGGDIVSLGAANIRGAKAGLRLRFELTAGLTTEKCAPDRIVLFLRDSHPGSVRLQELLLANAIGVLARRGATTSAPWDLVAEGAIAHLGLGDEHALLPRSPRTFSGYRLLREYFAFPARHLFVELRNVGAALRRLAVSTFEIVVLFNRHHNELTRSISADTLALHCAPAINLFPKRADRIRLNRRDHEFHVIPDRTRPLDFEVFSVTSATGFGSEREQPFEPFYASSDSPRSHRSDAYFTVHRTPRLMSENQLRRGPRSSYIGSEVYVALVDAREAPYSNQLNELSVETWCTNRDLALQMPVGVNTADFSLEAGGPVQRVSCLSGPTKPRPALHDGELLWRTVSHLSLNYLSLLDADEHQGAEALRELLALYGDSSEASVRRQVDGVKSVRARPVHRRLPSPGPITFGRGLEILVTVDESAFEGVGAFQLGAVLEQFFARYVSINSFTETVIETLERGEIKRWPTRLGQRHSC